MAKSLLSFAVRKQMKRIIIIFMSILFRGKNGEISGYIYEKDGKIYTKNVVAE
jgi:hypothetical protein